MQKALSELKRINITMNESLLKEVDEVAKAKLEDRSTAIRQLVAASVKEEKLRVAIQKFQENVMTLREAAGVANLSYWEFQQELDKRGLPVMSDMGLAIRRIKRTS